VFSQALDTQVSVVHGSPSLQSAAAEQQPRTAALPQTPLVQVSVVHGLESLQSGSLVQQPAIAVCPQV
jgi:hypothetical protein